MTTYHLGVDVGGTFTDVVAVDAQGQVTFTKVLSTPPDPSLGVMNGLDRLAGLLDSDLGSLLRSADRIVHGTTVATNALLERKGARVGMLTTEGHRDVIEMREGLKPDRYNLRIPAPEPLVPRRRRMGVRERLRADGTPSVHLDQRSLDAAIAALREQGVDSVAVCYLHAYRDDRHERETLRRVTRALPDAYVSLSSAVLPQIKEYERFGTTVVNAYVGPILAAYLLRLERRLTEAGFGNRLLVMQSHGGVAPVAEAVRLAAAAVLSGPAGGVAGGQYATKIVDAPDLITLDMGGTSTDVSLIVSGASPLASDRVVAGQPVALPSLDIAALGLGGGSIASADAGGLLRVGPTSAGADPGPACYGRGGHEATITDANLRPRLSGSEQLSRRSDDARRRRGRARPRPVGRAARPGPDRGGRRRPPHGGRPARQRAAPDLGSARLRSAGICAARLWRCGRTPRRRRRAAARDAAHPDPTGRGGTLGVGHAGNRPPLRAGAHPYRRHACADRRAPAAAVRRAGVEQYGLASATRAKPRCASSVRWTCATASRSSRSPCGIDDVDLETADVLERIVERFHRRHEALYTYSSPEHEVVLVNARLTGVGVLPELPKESVLPERPAASPRSRRQVYLGDWLAVPVFDFGALGAGQPLAGPAIVESDTTTVLLGPGDAALVTRLGWLDVSLGSSDRD